MSNSLNLSNNEIGCFNDIYMLKNTGQSSIYDIFGSKTDISNLGSISTTTLSQITNIVTSFTTLNSALNSIYTSISNINVELGSVEVSLTSEYYNKITSNSLLSTYTPLSTYNNTVATN